jgi:hypothetical protein
MNEIPLMFGSRYPKSSQVAKRIKTEKRISVGPLDVVEEIDRHEVPRQSSNVGQKFGQAAQVVFSSS